MLGVTLDATRAKDMRFSTSDKGTVTVSAKKGAQGTGAGGPDSDEVIVAADDRFFVTLKGIKVGEATITAKVPGIPSPGRLTASVKRRRIVDVKVFIVSDSSGHKSKVKVEDVSAKIEKASKILLDQANVSLNLVDTQTLAVPHDLGDTVDYKDGDDTKIVQASEGKGEPAEKVIYYVWDAAGDGKENVAGYAPYHGNWVLAESPSGAAGALILAHEFGHSFGLQDLYLDANHQLLYGGLLMDASGTRLRRVEIQGVNDNAP